MIGTGPNFPGVREISPVDRLLGIVNEQDFEPNSIRYQNASGDMATAAFTASTVFADISGTGPAIVSLADFAAALGAVVSTDPRVDALVLLSGVAALDEDLGTFTGSTLSDNLSIKAALQQLETVFESFTGFTGTIVSTDVGNEIIAGTDGGAYLAASTFSSSLISSDGGNQVAAGTDGKLFVAAPVIPAETVTSLAFATGTISYTDENGAITNESLVSTDTGNSVVVGTDGRLFAERPNTLNYTVADFVLSGINYVLSIPATTHLRSTNPSAIVWDMSSDPTSKVAFTTGQTAIHKTTGEIVVTTSSVPDGRRDIQVVVTRLS